MSERAIKLLEVATHPSTGDGERANAISMFRAVSDKAGGIDNLFGVLKPTVGDSDLYWHQEYTKARKDRETFERLVTKAIEQNAGYANQIREVSNARDEAVRELTTLRSTLRGLVGGSSPSLPANEPASPRSGAHPGSGSNDPHIALFGALDHVWRTIGAIDERAGKNGFQGAQNTLRKRLEKLTAACVIDHRHEQWSGHSEWRLR